MAVSALDSSRSAVFENLDGMLGLTPEDGDGNPIYLRLLYTDSGHYLVPIDCNKAAEETDQQFLHDAVMKHLASYWHRPRRHQKPGTATTFYDLSLLTPVDTDTGAKINKELSEKILKLNRSVQNIRENIDTVKISTSSSG